MSTGMRHPKILKKHEMRYGMMISVREKGGIRTNQLKPFWQRGGYSHEHCVRVL